MDAGRICAELVAIRSENPPGTTTDAIEYIRSLLEGLGVGSSITSNANGRSNLVTTGKKQRLLLCGHVDVVPAMDEGWTYPPFSGTVKDGIVWGRGATDMKGGCAALLAACDAVLQTRSELPATLAFVCDEETGGEYGVRYLLAHHLISPCDCVIAEPTPVRSPCIGQKGLLRLEMKFSGTPGHGSLYPAVGVSAIMEALSFLHYVNSLHEKEFPVDETLKKIIAHSSEVFSGEFNIGRGEEILQRLMFNPGVIHGGEKTNIVAQHCDLDLELRVPWGCDIPLLVADLKAHAPHGTVTSETVHEPSLTDPGCALVSIACREVRNVYGGDVSPIVQWAASDARHLRSAGFNVIEYGPGELSTLHAVNERVSIAALDHASAIYQGIMKAYI
ncbi:MAG: M20/M25/M40 family metallo-hydrolase [Methanoregula sp.]|jgi:succinyl-diaminopimelate desuccinylase